MCFILLNVKRHYTVISFLTKIVYKNLVIMMAQALLMTFSCILCYKHNKRNAVNTAISQEQNTLLYMVEII